MSDKNRITKQELMSWSDMTCEKMDEHTKFPIKEFRDLVILADYYERNYKTLKEIIEKGYLKGYQIQCPKCGVKYEITVGELNRKHEIVCQDCGHSYRQDENIIAMVCYEDYEGDNNEG